jgi:hypothetical protein
VAKHFLRQKKRKIGNAPAAGWAASDAGSELHKKYKIALHKVAVPPHPDAFLFEAFLPNPRRSRPLISNRH